MQVGQAKAQFLTECAKAMDGAPFYLQALSFDPSKNESAFDFKRVINLAEEGRQLFKAVSKDALPPVVKTKKQGGPSIKKLQGTVQRQHEEIGQLRGLVDSTSKEHQKLQSTARHLQKMLDATKMRAQAFEVLLNCCVCKSSKVSVAFLPCQHACCCRQCWADLVKSTGSVACPLCQKPTLGQMGIYLP